MQMCITDKTGRTFFRVNAIPNPIARPGSCPVCAFVHEDEIMPKPATYAELWETYDQAIQAMRSLVYVARDAAAEIQDMAPKLEIGFGSMSDQIDLDRLFAAIRAASAAIEKRNEMSRL